MPILTLKFKDNIIKTYPLKLGGSINIGRKASNDIVIANLTVSGRHARIDSTEEGYLLTDMKSKNGIFVNDEPFSVGYLKEGDIISVGKHTISFSLGEENKAATVKENADATMVMSDMPAQKHASKVVPKKKKRTAYLAYVEGGKGKISLSKGLVTIGKSSNNDIVIQGFMVGGTVATIKQTPQGYMISPSSGLTKVRINNEKLTRPKMLDEFDSIVIKDVELQFYYK